MMSPLVVPIDFAIWASFVTLPRPTSDFVTLWGLPLVNCEWSYAVLPRSPRYAVALVSPSASEALISTYADPLHR
jgi:hypothetical protein